ncbi:MAG: DUF6580 family putative transport protein [Bacteroidia bacterium]
MNLKTTTIFALILAGALLRLIPHAPNFSPIAAIALFGGAYISNKWLKMVLPVAALLISDLFLGFYGWGMISVYGSFMLIIALGSTMSNKVTPVKVGLNSIAGSVIFYLITNFAFLYPATLYPHNFTGIMQSYTAAWPFFQNALFGDLFYNTVLFGGFYILTSNVKVLQKA